MIKAKFKSGEPLLIIKIEHLVSVSVFASSLTGKFYRYNGTFPKTLSKREAMDILKTELRWSGDAGEYNDGVGEDNQEEWNNIYDDAKSWVLKNYPYLKP